MGDDVDTNTERAMALAGEMRDSVHIVKAAADDWHSGALDDAAEELAAGADLIEALIAERNGLRDLLTDVSTERDMHVAAYAEAVAERAALARTVNSLRASGSAIRAEMARAGIAPSQVLPYEDAERGWVDPLTEDTAATRAALGAVWKRCLDIEAGGAS